MKQHTIIILLSIILTGCQFGNQNSAIKDVSVIDLSKKYPLKEIILQDIADISYIPLETTNEVLLGDVCVIDHASDRYILIRDLMRDNIFVFDRKGKIVSHFNHRGNGAKEYNGINNVVLDEKKEELFVHSMMEHKFQIYSIHGAYKRTLTYSDSVTIPSVYDFDDETLLAYNDYRPYRDHNSETPYMFISKKDGQISPLLDIRMPVRYTNSIAQSFDLGGGQKGYAPLTVLTPNNRDYGSDFIIADISSDTIYMLTPNRDLTPLLVRTPSVHASEPRTVWTTLLTTDKFMVLNQTTIDFIAAEKGQSKPDVMLIHEFETGKTSEVSFTDSNWAKRKWRVTLSSMEPDNPKNTSVNLIHVHRLKEAYEENLLSGDLKKLTETLDENDNPIITIVTFK